MSALLYNRVNTDNIHLLSPDKLDNHYMCNMKYDDKILYVQTPSMKINEITSEYILLDIDDKFKKFIDDIDNCCIKYTYQKSNEWFKKDIPHDALINMYQNVDTDDNVLRLDFPYIKDKLQCNIYNSDRDSINIDDLKSGDKIILLLYFKGLKIYSSNFYLDFHINQIKLLDNEYKVLKDYSIIDDDEVNNSEIEDYIFKEDMDLSLKEEKLIEEQKRQKELELKKQKELDIKNKMKELQEQLNNLNN